MGQKGVAGVASGGLIILAEDDAQMRRLYVDFLNAAGFSVLAAADGIEALSFLSKAKPRLVILDIMMPKLNGIETCMRARKIIGDDVPILFLSALDRIAILRDCVAAGGDDYLIKSDSLKSLLERIKQWMHHSRRTGLSERRKTLLESVSGKLGAEESVESEARQSGTSDTDIVEAQESDGFDSDLAVALSIVRQALRHAGPQFGKTTEHKRRLAGYIAGTIEYCMGTRSSSDTSFLEHLQRVFEATGHLDPADTAQLISTYDELFTDTAFSIGRVHGRNDTAQRYRLGASYVVAGLTEGDAEHDLENWRELLST